MSLMPKTKEQVFEIIKEIYLRNAGDCFREKISERDSRVAAWLKREIDVTFSRGYNEESNTNITFCVKGSPNKMYGFMYEMHATYTDGGIVELLVVNSDWGLFFFNNNYKIVKTKKYYNTNIEISSKMRLLEKIHENN